MKKGNTVEVTTGSVRRGPFGGVHRHSDEVLAQIRSTLPADLELGHLLDSEHPYLAYASSLSPAVSPKVTRNKRTGFVTVWPVKAAAGAKTRKAKSAAKRRKATSAAKDCKG